MPPCPASGARFLSSGDALCAASPLLSAGDPFFAFLFLLRSAFLLPTIVRAMTNSPQLRALVYIAAQHSYCDAPSLSQAEDPQDGSSAASCRLAEHGNRPAPARP